MRTRRLIAAMTGLMCILAMTGPLTAEDDTILIELSARSAGRASAVSANGSVVAGTLATGGGFYWMPTTGAIFIGGTGVNGISRDGRTIVGTALDRGVQQAAIWLRAAEWRMLGSFTPTAAPCGLSQSMALGTSADGQVVVGQAYNNGCAFAHAFRWEESTGMVDLGSLVADRSSSASGLSADARVIVGRQERADGAYQGTRWTDRRQEHIPPSPGTLSGYVGAAKATNRDGSIIVGQSCYRNVAGTNIDDQSAWVWTSGGTECLAVPTFRPSPGPPVIGEANALSDDGRIIGGGQRIGTDDSDAIVWVDKKPVYLKDLLRANGVANAFETWPRTGAIEGVSPDGRVLVGWGAAAAGFRGYVVILGSNLVVP